MLVGFYQLFDLAPQGMIVCKVRVSIGGAVIVEAGAQIGPDARMHDENLYALIGADLDVEQRIGYVLVNGRA
jgi:hypothetical protein